MKLRDVRLGTTRKRVLRLETVGSGIDLDWLELVGGSGTEYGPLAYGDDEYGN